MPAIFSSLFDLLALLYLFRSVQLGVTIWRERQAVAQDPLTPHKKHLAEQASFFIAVPIGVLIHEFGHAVAVWLAGGQVASFNYRVFWGYVVPVGTFTPAQEWFIAIAGTIGSLLFGLAIWLLLRNASSAALRYFGLRAFRFQVYFSLLYYPVFTLLGFVGDWRTIYDFGATPLLSAATAVAHAGTLLLFWYGERIGWFEAPSHETLQSQQQYEQLTAEAAAHPQDPARQLAYIDALRRGGATKTAKHRLQQFLQANPHSAAAYLQLAALTAEGDRHVSRQASEHAQEALNLGLDNPRQTAYAHQIISRHALEAGHQEEAITHLTQAIAAVTTPRLTPQTATPATAVFLAQLHLLRSQAYRRQSVYEAAGQDLQQAQAYAQAAGSDALQKRVQDEMDVLQKHAGHAINTPANVP